MRLMKALLPGIVGLAAVIAGAPAAATTNLIRVVDDTGTMAISVPATWGSIDTVPLVDPDRTVHPTISASDYPAEFPSMSVVAESFQAELTIRNIEWCTRHDERYSQGDFTGVRTRFTACEGGLLYQEVVANPSGQQFTVRVSFAYESAADETTIDAILASLEATGAAYPPPSATAPRGCFIRCHDDVASIDASASPPAPFADPAAPVWPYGPFWNVPRLGSEPVRGTGCGSAGQIGDVIPDGLWAGYVTNETTPMISIDLLCVFFDAAAQHVAREGTANIVNSEPDYLVVNNNTRHRTMPAAPGIALRDSAVLGGECVENFGGAHNPAPARQAWIRIDGGQVTWILWGCGFPAMPAAAQPPNLAPAYPDYSDGIGSVWPYGTFRNVPQLGREPSRGSGCGASGQLGAMIPDGLWAGFVAGYNSANNAVAIDVLCIFAGDTAQAVLAGGNANVINNEPDYLIVNNNPQLRFMPGDLAAIITGQVDASGRCVEGTHNPPPAVDVIAARTTQQAWIRIANGVVTWIFYGC